MHYLGDYADAQAQNCVPDFACKTVKNARRVTIIRIKIGRLQGRGWDEATINLIRCLLPEISVAKSVSFLMMA